MKERSEGNSPAAIDAVRGDNKGIYPSTGAAEYTETNLSFDADGFSLSVRGSSAQINKTGETYVGWQWLEDATPGFDIVSFTGNGSNRTISHSLSAVPELMILKNLDTDIDWSVYTAMTGNTHYLGLNSTAVSNDNDEYWNDTTPTSSVFTVGTHNSVNKSSSPFIAYLWAGVEGFSSFGKYTGNGNADGPFIWCGFRPAWVVMKATTSVVKGWNMFDSTRSPFNIAGAQIQANSNDAEATLNAIDILSNGFKLRTTDDAVNNSGAVYVFLAFGETPFKTANAR
jgi:hypothetical protein